MPDMSVFRNSSFRRRLAERLATPRIPAHLRRRFGSPSQAGRRAVLSLLRDEWHSDGAIDRPGARETPEDRCRDLEERTDRNRRLVIPWLDAACRLEGASILEVGCGTGCGTVPLAEQGARVVGVDLRDDSLRVARARLEAQGLSARLVRLNAEDLSSLAGESFDMVLFWASLEHMTIPERLAALRGAWNLLPSGGFLGAIDTPNRLWDFDAHASQLPFFHWLPPELALPWAGKNSPRPSCRLCAAEKIDALYRYGSSVSFHEFALALGPIERLPVVSGLNDFLRRRNLARRLRWRFSRDRKYARLLRRRSPRLPEAFFEESLQLLIRKP